MSTTTKEKLQEQAIQAIKEYVQKKDYDYKNLLVDEVYALLGQNRGFEDRMRAYELNLVILLEGIANPEVCELLREKISPKIHEDIVYMLSRMISFFKCLDHEPTLINLELYGIENYCDHHEKILEKIIKEYKIKLAGLEAERKMEAALEADNK